jgi:hypothetical protein
MSDLVENPGLARAIGKAAKLDIQRENSYLAIGKRFIDRLSQLSSGA